MSTGNRIAPAGLKACASCGVARGTKSKGWQQVTRSGEVVGWTCPDCPRADEPIRREATGRFVAVVGVRGQDGARTQRKRRFADLSDAREWVAETRTAPVLASDYQLTVRVLADRWLAKRAAEVGTPGGIRACTLNGYRSALSSLLDVLGEERAREVTPDDVEAALRKLATEGGKWGRPLSSRSLGYALGAVRQAYAFARRSGWVRQNPAAEAKAPRVTRLTGEAGKRWTPAELVRFREHLDAVPLDAEPWLRAGYRLTLCGLRRSEVLGLDWSAVDTKNGQVSVRASRTKDGVGSSSSLNAPKVANSYRSVAAEVVHPGTAAALRELWLQQGRPTGGLVIKDAAGVPVQPDAFSRRFKALCKAAGVAYPGSIHQLRHTLATALQEAGVPDVQGAALLGHDVATFRKFYLVTDDDGAAAAAAVAGRLFAV